MITFKQLLEKLFESRHDSDAEETARLVNLPHAEASKNKEHKNFEGRIARALVSHHSDDDEEMERVLDHNSKHPLAWIRAHVAKNKHIHKFPHILQRLQNDPQKRVKETADAVAAKSGSKPAEVSTPTPKVVKPKAIPTPAPKPKVEKPAEPVEKKAPGSFSVQKGDTEDFPYSTQVSHVVDHKGRKKGTVVSLRIPSEYGQDRVHHVAYVGNHNRGGLQELGSHENHLDAMKALGKHLKNN